MSRIVWSYDQESFNFDSLGEVIDQLMCDEEIGPGRVVYFGEAVAPRTMFVDADDVIEDIGNRAYDDGGEWADDFPNVSAEGKAELETFLREWQERHCKPTWFSVENVREHTITADDLEPTP